MAGRKHSDKEILAAIKKAGTQRGGAELLGIDVRTLERRLSRIKAGRSYDARANIESSCSDIDPGIRDAAHSTGLSLDSARHGWRRIQREDGAFDSVFWKQDSNESAAHAWADIFREALVDAPRSVPTPPPSRTRADCLPRYLIADVHWGMRSWDVETGENYDIDIASRRFSELMGECLEYTPPCNEALILNLGDSIHTNDASNMTPASKHVLDVDSRPGKIMYESVKAQVAQIEAAKAKHKHVRVVILGGNHDPDLSQAIGIAITMRFEEDSRVTVDWHPRKLWAMRFGNVLLAAHHGDQTKPERLALQVADDYAPLWGKTYWRYLDTGHIHHDHGKDIGGVYWQAHRAITGRDAAAAGMGYTSRRTMKSILVHREEGEKTRQTAGITLPFRGGK